MSNATRFNRLFETFESRLLLSGNVIARVIDGHLFIRGDARSNVIQITEGLEGGLRLIGDDDTRINGKFAPLELTDIKKDIRVNLGLGNNDLRLVKIDAPRDLRITTGIGIDRIHLQSVNVGEDLRIHSGAGQDLINLLDVTVDDETRIDSGVGSDLVTADNSEFLGRFRLDAGHGRDTIFLGDSTFADDKQVRGGPGDDLIEDDPLSFSYDFRQGAQGWSAGFADF